MATNFWFSFTPDPRTSANLSPTFLNFAKFDGTSLTPPGITQPFTGTGLYTFPYTPTFSIAFLLDGATTGGGLTLLTRYIVGSLDASDRISDLLAESGTTNVAFGSTLFGQGVTNIALGTTNVALGITAIGQGNTNIALGTTNIALGTTNIALGTTNIGYGVSNLALGTTMVAIGTTLMGFGLSLVGSNLAIGSTASVYGGSASDPVDLFGYMKRIREFLEGDQSFNKTTGSWAIFARSGATLLVTKTLTNAAAGVTRA